MIKAFACTDFVSVNIALNGDNLHPLENNFNN